MRDATEAEFNAVKRAHQTTMRHMQAGRSVDFYYTKYGTGKEIASKHELLSRGKVKSTSYMIDPAYLPGE
jgi:hypothetical protein